MICVFIACLLPGFVSSRFRSVWANIGALVLSVVGHVLFDMYSSDEVWANVFNAILCTAITLLVLLSICAVLAGKTIRIIINKKLHSKVSTCRNCGNIGDHVLRCWILVRCSQPEYIMARSVLSSLAGLLVTVCVILMVVKWSLLGQIDFDGSDTLLQLNEITFLIQFAFVLVGWMVVSFRWLTAVIYFPIDRSSLVQVEDFWTRSITELKYGPLDGPLFREKRNRDRTQLEGHIVDLIIAVRLHILLLSIGLLVQKLVVLLSKASCVLSSILFMPVLKIHEKFLLLCGSSKKDSEFPSYSEFSIYCITMPGESAGKLWKANEWAFKSTKKHMEQGKDSTEDLIEMIRRLQRKAPVADGGKDAEEKYLKYDGQKSWKIRAVSLIHFMLCYYRDTNSVVVDEAFKACSEAWPLMDFVESSDTKANLASLAADKEFNTLENIWRKKLKVKPNQSDPKLTIRNRMIQNIESKLKIKSSQSDSKLTIRDTMIQDIKSRISKRKIDGKGDNTQDSMEKMMAAANSSLYKTRRVIKSKAINLRSANAIHTLGYLVASVIVDCLANELKNALTEKCSKWAVEGEEQKIYHAAYIAGKAMGVSDLFQTSQGNNEVPEGDVEEGEGNNACGGGGQENNSCGILEAADVMHEDLQEAEDDAESGGDNEDVQEAEDDAECGGDNNC